VVLLASRGAGTGREQQVEEPQQEAGHGGPEAKLPDDDCDDPTRTTASERRLTISLSLSGFRVRVSRVRVSGFIFTLL